MKKVTVTLSDKAEQFLNELLYSLTKPTKTNDAAPANISDCVSHALETMADFEDATQDQLVNWLQENHKWYDKGEAVMHYRKKYIGLEDGKGKRIYEGDMYFEEDAQDDGSDIRIFFVVKWIKEWAMFALLSMGELPDYEDNGIDALDDVMRNTFVLDAAEFKKLHFKGNVFENKKLLEIVNEHTNA